MSSPFAKKFCGKKSGLHYGKGPLHNEPEKKGKTVNEVKPVGETVNEVKPVGKTVNEVNDSVTAARWLENHAKGDIVLKTIEIKRLKEVLNS